ncbi:MAG TPA: Mrp/NBP35 family ATP-binding protein [Polyangiaceae bacterium]|nr:Mrp/NBP35 family ATP-binding protein [Polyangiaceae bacterium]
MASLEDRILEQLRGLGEPGSGRTLGELDALVRVQASEGRVTVVLRLGEIDPALLAQVRAKVTEISGVQQVNVEIEPESGGSRRPVGADDPVPEVDNVVLVMSGKGGVGKSTVAANLALALARSRHRVGLLDADIYGPSVPTMFGITGQPMSDGHKIQPLQRFGVKLMSIGFLLEDPRSAVVWRGPMLHGALVQFLKDVNWGKLDYLLLDLPPGTGDIALTLSQKIRTTGAVMVTTPQEVALQDVYKAVSMAQKVGIPILGVVENESYFVCGGCQARHELFGSGGGQKVAEMANAPLLGQIPIEPSVREWGDAGTPVVQAAPGAEVSQAFMQIAARMMARAHEENSAAAGGFTIDRSGGQNRHLPVAR